MNDMTDLEDDWFNFCDGNDISNDNFEKKEKNNLNKISLPKCSDIYISTKTKIAFLNSDINLYEIFWKIIVNEYHNPIEGVIKKQMKFNSNSLNEVEDIKTKLNDLHKNDHIDEYVLNHIDNPNGRIKFKDVRKISIGLSKKDITSYRCKKKSAFYNCFVLIIRLLNNNVFKEIHVKVFNTGKLEIPGIQNDEIFSQILNLILNILRPFTNKNLDYLKKSETVLINSNFNCGYYIDRDKLYYILKNKYKSNSVYDPCSYPGIQSEFYYNINEIEQTGQQPFDNNNCIKVSFMIFRTGSVLIVGKCTEIILNNIYIFLKTLLNNEFQELDGEIINIEDAKPVKNKKKIRKKIILNNI